MSAASQRWRPPPASRPAASVTRERGGLGRPRRPGARCSVHRSSSPKRSRPVMIPRCGPSRWPRTRETSCWWATCRTSGAWPACCSPTIPSAQWSPSSRAHWLACRRVRRAGRWRWCCPQPPAHGGAHRPALSFRSVTRCTSACLASASRLGSALCCRREQIPREQNAPRPATAKRYVTLEPRTVPSLYVDRQHRTGAHSGRRRELVDPLSGDDDGAAHVENASVAPTQGHDQGDSTDVHLARRLLRRADGSTRPPGRGRLDAGPGGARVLRGHAMGDRRRGLARAAGIRRRRALDQLRYRRGDVRGGWRLRHGPAHVRRRRDPVGWHPAVPGAGLRRGPSTPRDPTARGGHVLHVRDRRHRASRRTGSPGRRRVARTWPSPAAGPCCGRSSGPACSSSSSCTSRRWCLIDEAASTSCRASSATHPPLRRRGRVHAQAAEPGSAVTRMPRPNAVSAPPTRTDPPLTEGAPAMSLVRVQQISVSLDGFATGEGQSHDTPFGHAGERLHEWMFATRWWRERVSEPGGTGGVDDAFARLHNPGIGAEIMGAGKFGPPGWHEDKEWKGWWGPNPPFHTPTFVLTHHPRPSIEMEGGTMFHFVDASPAEALETARGAAGGQDVRLGGGPTMIRDFLAAELVDHMHIVVVPILLGRGVRLWDGLEGLEKDYEVEAVSSPSGVTHVTFSRAGV